MKPQTPLEAALEDAIYTDRLLVFLEGRDGFRQVLLSKEQFKRVSDACLVEAGEPDIRGNQLVELNLGEQLIPKEPFEGMSDFEV